MFMQLHGACRGHKGVVRYMYTGCYTDGGLPYVMKIIYSWLLAEK